MYGTRGSDRGRQRSVFESLASSRKSINSLLKLYRSVGIVRIFSCWPNVRRRGVYSVRLLLRHFSERSLSQRVTGQCSVHFFCSDSMLSQYVCSFYPRFVREVMAFCARKGCFLCIPLDYTRGIFSACKTGSSFWQEEQTCTTICLSVGVCLPASLLFLGICVLMIDINVRYRYSTNSLPHHIMPHP